MSTLWNLHFSVAATNNKLCIAKDGLMKAVVGMFVWVMASSACADGSGQWKDGKEAYDKVCAYCHETGVGPTIKSRGSPKEYLSAVRYGLRAMPPFRKAEIDDVILAQLMEYIN